jgi:hypothetical protein
MQIGLALSDLRIHRQNRPSGARRDQAWPVTRLRPVIRLRAVRAAPSETAAAAMHCQPPTVNGRYLLSVLVDESAEDPGQAR